MNDRQRIIIKLAVAVIVGMLVYPPFHIELKGIVHNLGYAFIFSPPAYGRFSGTVSIGLLLLQWLAVGIVAGFLWWLAQEGQTLPNRETPAHGANGVKPTTKLRLIGGAILLFNLWLIGEYNLSGVPVLLLTVGFVIGYEALVVRPASRPKDGSSG